MPKPKDVDRFAFDFIAHFVLVHDQAAHVAGLSCSAVIVMDA